VIVQWVGGASCRKLYGHKHHLCHSALAFVLRHAHAVRLRTICAPGCPLTATRGSSSHFQRPPIGAIDAPCCPLSGPGINKNWANSFFCALLCQGIDVVHGGMCTCALLTPLTFTQCWIHEATMRPLLNPVPLKQRLPAAFPT
jgi:hypothetical protein